MKKILHPSLLLENIPSKNFSLPRKDIDGFPLRVFESTILNDSKILKRIRDGVVNQLAGWLLMLFPS